MSLRSLSTIVPLLALVLGLSLASGQEALGQEQQATTAEDTDRHAQFTRLLADYVDEQGRVDYAGLKQAADSRLEPYLQQLAETNPANLSRDARLAFWINAYNAYALKLIVDHYPVSTIWATTPGPAEPSKENSPFQMDVGPVADTARTLDEIEHEIIRKRFDEPRIHFAVVCAAADCPPLRREAYTGPQLDDQLDDQGRTFLHNDQKNKIPAGDDRIALTSILKWFGSDFGSSTDDVQKYIARYFEGTVRERLAQADYEVEFLSYDWSLNAQGEVGGEQASSK